MIFVPYIMIVLFVSEQGGQCEVTMFTMFISEQGEQGEVTMFIKFIDEHGKQGDFTLWSHGHLVTETLVIHLGVTVTLRLAIWIEWLRAMAIELLNNKGNIEALGIYWTKQFLHWHLQLKLKFVLRLDKECAKAQDLDIFRH